MYNMMGSVDVTKLSSNMLSNDLAVACIMPMGITSENVAEQWKITRAQQDQMAVDSHAKAVAAQKQGLFDAEIVPVVATVKDKAGGSKQVTISQDEGPRAGTTLESLSKLKPALRRAAPRPRATPARSPTVP